MFKKIKFQIAESSTLITTMEGKDVTLEEAIRLLKNPNIINFTATKMTPKEFFMKNNSKSTP